MAIFNLTDYAVMQYIDGVFMYRAYLLKVSNSILITGLLNPVMGDAALPAYVVIFDSNENAVPLSIKGYVTISVADVGKVERLAEPIRLTPGNWYLLATGGTGESVVPRLASVVTWTVADMIAAENFIETWLPVRFTGTNDNQFYGYSRGPGFPHPDSMIGLNWNLTGEPNIDARPYIGFEYTDGFNIWVKKSGVYEPVTDIWVKKSGSWQSISGVWTKKGGSWNTI